MRRFIFIVTIAFCFVCMVLTIADRLPAEEKAVSSAQVDAHFTKSTHPVDILKDAAKRALETLKGMIFKGGEGGYTAEKREEIMRERAEETKAAGVAEGSSR